MDKNSLEKVLADLEQELSRHPKVREGKIVGIEYLPQGPVVISVNGWAIGINTSSTVFSRICSALDEAQRDIIFNLENCPYLSSLAMGDIAKLAQKNISHGFNTLIIKANSTIRDLINLLSLQHLFMQANSVDEALKLLQQSSSGDRND
jgi:anti-anti-sigma factor